MPAFPNGNWPSPKTWPFADVDVGLIVALRSPEEVATIEALNAAKSFVDGLQVVSEAPEACDQFDANFRRFVLKFDKPLYATGKIRESNRNRRTELHIGLYCINAVGPESASTAARHVAERFRPKCIAMAGIAGGLYPSAADVGDVAFAAKATRILLRPSTSDPLAFEALSVHDCSAVWQKRCADFQKNFSAAIARAPKTHVLPAGHKLVSAHFATSPSPVYDVKLRDRLAGQRLTVIDQEVGSVMHSVADLAKKKGEEAKAYEARLKRRIPPWPDVPIVAIKAVTDHCDNPASQATRVECARRASIALVAFICAHKSEIAAGLV